MLHAEELPKFPDPAEPELFPERQHGWCYDHEVQLLKPGVLVSPLSDMLGSSKSSPTFASGLVPQVRVKQNSTFCWPLALPIHSEALGPDAGHACGHLRPLVCLRTQCPATKGTAYSGRNKRVFSTGCGSDGGLIRVSLLFNHILLRTLQEVHAHSFTRLLNSMPSNDSLQDNLLQTSTD